MNRKVKCMLLVISGLLSLGITNGVLGAEKGFPEKPIELISPWGAGGSVSVGGRIIAGTLTQFLETPVILINKTGGGGAVGTAYVAKSKPDGYTLLVANLASNVIMPSLRSVDFKKSSFEALGLFARQDLPFVVKSDAPWKTLKELVAHAKKEPGKLKYCTPGTGTATHFTMELFKSAAGGLKIDHVPFKSGPEAVVALLGGHVHVGCLNMIDIKGSVDAGRLRILASPTEERLEDYPDIPIFAELGYPEVKLWSWFGIAAPIGVPKEVSDKLKIALYKTIKHPDVKMMIRNTGCIPVFKDSEEFNKFLNEEEKKILKIAKEAGIRLD
jgi:tripartite-type tricarboxylate transporter receptor subunit TctC